MIFEIIPSYISKRFSNSNVFQYLEMPVLFLKALQVLNFVVFLQVTMIYNPNGNVIFKFDSMFFRRENIQHYLGDYFLCNSKDLQHTQEEISIMITYQGKFIIH